MLAYDEYANESCVINSTLSSRVYVSHSVDKRRDVNHIWDFLVNMFQERQVLLMTVSSFALCDSCAVCNSKNSKKCCGLISNMIMSNSLDITESNWQHGLSVIHGLTLSCFSNIEYLLHDNRRFV